MKLTIDFEGLCALVRDKPGRKGRGTVRVVFVDALKAQGPLCEHKPRLLVNLDDTNSKPGDIMGLPDGQQVGIWDLHHQDARIITGVPPAKRVLNIRDTRKWKESPVLHQRIYVDEVPQYEETWNDISWVPEMSRVIGNGDIDPDCLLPKKPPQIVAARLTIDEGLLESVVDGD